MVSAPCFILDTEIVISSNLALENHSTALTESEKKKWMDIAKTKAEEKIKGNESLQRISAEFVKRFRELKQEFEGNS